MNGSLDNTGDMAEYSAPSRADTDAMRREALLASADLPAADSELLAALTSLSALADQPVPKPSPELALMLAAAGRPAVRRLSPRKAIAGAGLTTAILLGAGGVAAATDNLPNPAKRVVSGVVSGLMPFEMPRAHLTPTPSRPVSSTQQIPAPGVAANPAQAGAGANGAACSTGGAAPCAPGASPPGPDPSIERLPGGSGESEGRRPDPSRNDDERKSDGRIGFAPSTSPSSSHEHDGWSPGSSPHGSGFGSPTQSQGSRSPSASPDPSPTGQPGDH